MVNSVSSSSSSKPIHHHHAATTTLAGAAGDGSSNNSISRSHRFPSWLSSMANDVMKQFDISSNDARRPTKRDADADSNDDDSEDDDDDDDDEEEDQLSSLLWEAQVGVPMLHPSLMYRR